MIYLFDIDGTLTPSRLKIDPEFEQFFLQWMKDKEVIFVTGSDKDELMSYARQLNAGQIHLNYGSAGSDAPFGGYKKSGNGREKAEWGLEEFLEIKAIMIFYNFTTFILTFTSVFV